MKRFLVLLLVISIAIIPFGAAAFADQSASKIVSEEPSTRGSYCDKCGSYSVQYVSTSYTSWEKTGDHRDCTHGYNYGDDIEESRYATKKYKCMDCNAVTYTSYRQYRWVCEGHN